MVLLLQFFSTLPMSSMKIIGERADNGLSPILVILLLGVREVKGPFYANLKLFFLRFLKGKTFFAYDGIEVKTSPLNSPVYRTFTF